MRFSGGLSVLNSERPIPIIATTLSFVSHNTMLTNYHNLNRGFLVLLIRACLITRGNQRTLALLILLKTFLLSCPPYHSLTLCSTIASQAQGMHTTTTKRFQQSLMRLYFSKEKSAFKRTYS